MLLVQTFPAGLPGLLGNLVLAGCLLVLIIVLLRWWWDQRNR